MKLLKFGGTSLANSKLFLHVANIIEKNIKYEQIAVVLSAPAKITNYLADIIETKIYNDTLLEKIDTAENIFIEIIRNINQEESCFLYKKTKKIIIEEFNKLRKIVHNIISLKKCSENIQAIIISLGEILSVIIMKNILISKNYQVTIINPIENIIAIGNYLNANVDIYKSKKNINALNINKNNIILMAGFIAGNEKKELVVLGRNGSDYSAAILSVCLNARLLEIWTDVDGVFTADPRKIYNSYLLKSITYQEAMELSYFGATVLHPKTISPIAKFQIPCLIKNTNNVQSTGTLISKENTLENNHSLKGITHLDNVIMITICNTNTKNIEKIISCILLNQFKKNIKIILMTQSSSENNISFCTFEKNINIIFQLLKKECILKNNKDISDCLKINKNLSILSIVGSYISHQYNLTSKIFSILGLLKINVIAIAQGSSKYSLSVVISKKYVLKAIKNIHDILFFKQKILHVFLIGIGGVGKALLQQIMQQKILLNKKNIEIKICLIANSKKFLLEESINLNKWEDNFKKSKLLFNLDILNKLLTKYSYLNSVIIDCTSNQTLSKQYINFISKGFHIVTSNKKANTESLKYYNSIRNMALKKNKKFLYETNVGAGLPVIQTLQNLFNTGDHLISFKGILSGSLSFIFGRLEEGVVLSEATKEAKKLGFTEPHPYDDLSGIDVARKLLILAREVGYSIELEDIKVESILPKSFEKNKNTQQFLLNLKKLDAYFLDRVNKARSLGCVLRFIGTISNTGKCSVKIKAINNNHPLYFIKNGENALTFYTNYYQPTPLILRGYGAGNNVTASGVFSNLLHTIL